MVAEQFIMSVLHTEMSGASNNRNRRPKRQCQEDSPDCTRELKRQCQEDLSADQCQEDSSIFTRALRALLMSEKKIASQFPSSISYKVSDTDVAKKGENPPKDGEDVNLLSNPISAGNLQAKRNNKVAFSDVAKDGNNVNLRTENVKQFNIVSSAPKDRQSAKNAAQRQEESVSIASKSSVRGVDSSTQNKDRRVAEHKDEGMAPDGPMHAPTIPTPVMAKRPKHRLGLMLGKILVVVFLCWCTYTVYEKTTASSKTSTIERCTNYTTVRRRGHLEWHTDEKKCHKVKVWDESPMRQLAQSTKVCAALHFLWFVLTFGKGSNRLKSVEVLMTMANFVSTIANFLYWRLVYEWPQCVDLGRTCIEHREGIAYVVFRKHFFDTWF